MPDFSLSPRWEKMRMYSSAHVLAAQCLIHLCTRQLRASEESSEQSTRCRFLLEQLSPRTTDSYHNSSLVMSIDCADTWHLGHKIQRSQNLHCIIRSRLVCHNPVCVFNTSIRRSLSEHLARKAQEQCNATGITEIVPFARTGQHTLTESTTSTPALSYLVRYLNMTSENGRVQR